ncbi:hypothetical protein [Desulfosporosinus youngiae]|uniref:Phage transcriptional regulator, RinA family n=1 Tax=Desulfosporosinus youngiae DSM 17734 TaxID=768710 RepID=H5XZW4_9FIRM|nr:hypothetical protein [Desulfosporosinus youngiae]EHQ92160.1 hypothetical protein DesyoDRAFT_5229 [Desulfosporosinus youngiae DSM 17734]
MNYIKEAENILWYYNDLYRSVENMNREIAKIVSRQSPSELNAISLEPTGVRGSGDADDNTYNLMFRLKTLTDNLNATMAELSKVDRILEDISQESGCELYGEVLREWYIERTPKDEIGPKIGYGRRNVYYIKDKAIKKFAVRHFGLDAVKAI